MLECAPIILCQVCLVIDNSCRNLAYLFSCPLPSPLPACLQFTLLGKPATLQDSNHPDWVPSLKMGYDVAISKDAFERYSRLQARKRKQVDVDTAESLLLLAGCESGTLCIKQNGCDTVYTLAFFSFTLFVLISPIAPYNILCLNATLHLLAYYM